MWNPTGGKGGKNKVETDKKRRTMIIELYIVLFPNYSPIPRFRSSHRLFSPTPSPCCHHPRPLFSPDTNHQPRPSLSINSLSPSLSRPIPTSVSYIVDRSRGMDGRFGSCFEESIREQDADLNELVEAMQSERRESEAELRELVEKSMRHYEEYSEKRRALAREDGSIFLCPRWNTAFENSFLWLGGCRPSLVIRLIYALSGSELAAHLDEFLAPGGGSAALRGGLVGLSASQLALVNELHRWTVKEEDKLSTKMATLQEDLGDIPLLTIVKDWGRGTAAAPTGGRNGWNEEVKAVMKEFAEKLGRKVGEADKLRVATTRKLMTEILTPLQAVELLVAAKQLHLAIRNWSQRWDLDHLRRG